MKKILALGMALAMTVSLCACSFHVGKETPVAEEETPAEVEEQLVENQAVETEEPTSEEPVEAAPSNEIVGIFKLVEIQSEDSSEAASAEDIKLMDSLGLICYVEFTDDGQAKLSMFGEEINGTWEGNVVTLEGEAIPVELEGDSMKLAQDGTTLIFERTDEEAAASASSTDFLAGLEDLAEDVEDSELTRARIEDVEYVVEGDGVLVDNDECRITVTEYDPNGDWGFVIKLNCENKTEDKTLMFSTSEGRVNGYAIDPFWAESVAPGKQTNAKVEFDNSDLDEAGISSIDEIILPITVYDDDDWSADYIVNDTFTLRPTGLAEDEVVVPERMTAETEQVIVDNDELSFIILETEEDAIWGYTIKGFVENKTDAAISLSWENVSVNGLMIDPFWADTVPAHAREYVEISFNNDELKENGIESIDEIEFALEVNDYDSWNPILNEVYTFAPAGEEAATIAPLNLEGDVEAESQPLGY